MDVVNLANAFGKFQDLWSPRIAGEVNNSYLKLAKLKREYFGTQIDMQHGQPAK